MKTIKVDKVILYYMDRVDPDGNLYRFYVIKYGICRYAYRICIDSYPGYVVKDPITLIEWVQGLKPGTVIKIRGIFIYHFL